MSSTDDGPRPEDHDDDPTGVRELLSGLPDPGPMPDHVAARIAATLDEHDRQRSGPVSGVAASPGGTETGGQRADSVASIELDRRRAPRGLWLVAGAAAVVTVGVVGVAAYDRIVGLGDAPEAEAQYVPLYSSEGGEPSAENAEPEQSPALDSNIARGAANSQAEQTGEDGVDTVDAVAQLDDSIFAAGAGALLDGAADGTPPRSLPAAFELIGADARALSPKETESCVRATGQSPNGAGWVAAPAMVAQTDVVVVSDRAASEPRAWAVSADCVANPSASVLHGPTDLP